MLKKSKNNPKNTGEITPVPAGSGNESPAKENLKFKKKSKKKLFLIGGAVLLLAFGGYSYFSSKQAQVVELNTASLETGRIEKNISINGQVSGSDSAEIGTNLSYEFTQINVKEGDQVVKGQILGVLDNSALKSDYDMAAKDLESSQALLREQQDTASMAVKERNADYAEAKRQNDIAKALFEQGGISNDEMVQSNIALEKATLALEAAKDNYNKASSGSAAIGIDIKKEVLQTKKENLDKANIVSPIDGTVTRVNAKLGRIPTAADQVKALFVVENLQDLVIDVTISEYDINKIKLGQQVKITSDVLGTKELAGKVSSIAPTGEAATGAASREMRIPVKIKVLQRDPSFIAGVNAKAEILVESKDNVLVAPLEAVFDADGSKYVLLGNDDTIQRVKVETGIENLTSAEIISNELKAGDLLITNPKAEYQDGMAYKAAGATTGATNE